MVRHSRQKRSLRTAPGLQPEPIRLDGGAFTPVLFNAPQEAYPLGRQFREGNNPVKSKFQIEARLKEIGSDLERLLNQPEESLSEKQWAHLRRLTDEAGELQAQLKTHKRATALGGYASPEEFGMGNTNPGAAGYGIARNAVVDDPVEQKAAEHGLATRKHFGPSPFQMTNKQLSDLYSAGRSNMSYGTTIGKGAERNMELIDKTVSEGAVGSLLPPILLPSAYQLRLEPVRIAEFFTAVEAGGQAITFLQHSGSALPQSGEGMSVAENAEKPTLGMTLTEQTVPFSVVAAVETVSKQMWTDFESIPEFLPREISNQVVQGENWQILSGSGTGADQTGLLNQPNILTREYTEGGFEVSPIDTILEAANDIRLATGYGQADLVILNPTDWLHLKQTKTTFNSFVLRQNDPGELGGIDHLFQLRVAETTSMPQGTALVLDSKIAVNIFRRWGLTVEVNPFAGTEFTQNQLLVRAETRFGVGCIYPKTVCKVEGLPA